jgi:hypothetical protein
VAEQYSNAEAQWGDYLNSSFHHGREQEPEYDERDDAEYDEWLAEIQPLLEAEQAERDRKAAAWRAAARHGG